MTQTLKREDMNGPFGMVALLYAFNSADGQQKHRLGRRRSFETRQLIDYVLSSVLITFKTIFLHRAVDVLSLLFMLCRSRGDMLE